MNKLLNQLNSGLRNRAGGNDKGKQEIKDFLLPYKHLKETGGTIEVKFVSVDKAGTHHAVDDHGVALELLQDDMKLSSYQKRAGSMLGANLTVAVKDIDEVNNTVYFSMSRKKSTLSASVNAAIRQDLAKGKPIRVWGRITAIYPPKGKNSGNAWIRLLDQDVVGNIDVREWSKGFTPDLSDVCKVGEMYEFDVIGQYSTSHKTGMPIWRCSRREIAEDPWKSLPTDFAEGNVILIKAVNKPEGKTYFWGSSPLAPNISIMCNYNPKFRITIGAFYRCKIDKLDIPGRFFRVSPFDVCPISNLDAVDTKKLANEVSAAEAVNQ